jgi:hypothetical protein
MEDAAAAGERKPMTYRIRIFAAAAVFSLCIGLAAPAQAWPGGDHGARPAADWWQATVDALATLFGLDLTNPKRDGSCSIDPNGNPVCPASQPTLQVDGSVCIDPWGNTVCNPGS